LPAGEHRLRWDGRMASGRVAPDGVYFLDVETARGRLRARVAVVH